MGHILN
jgi:hypothetical protein